MRERARDKGRLQDIIEYADNVTMLIKGFDLEMLVTDKRTYYSVVKNIEVVGEAACISPRPTGKHGSPPPTILTPMRIWQKSPAA